jgi:hypothetical protein
MLICRLDQAYAEVGEDDTVFSGGRSSRYAVFVIATGPTPEVLAADRTWATSFWEALRPHSLGFGMYVNGMAEFEDDRVRASYGPAKYQRLAKIKGKNQGKVGLPESVPPQRQHPPRMSLQRARRYE